MSYEPFGPVKALALGNGLSVANGWDAGGRLASRRLYRTSNGENLSWLAYQYDSNDNIGAIRDRLVSGTVYIPFRGQFTLTPKAAGPSQMRRMMGGGSRNWVN